MAKSKELKELENQASEDELKRKKKILDELYEAHKRAGIPQAEPREYDQMDLQTPTYEKMGFTLQDVAMIFLDHRYLPRSLVAEKYGMERAFFGDPKKPVNVIQRIYQDVTRKPDRYAEYLTEDDIREVLAVVSSRIGTVDYSTTYGVAKSVKTIVAQPVADIVKKYNTITDKAANVVELLLDSIKNKKDIKTLDIKKMTDALKTLNDLKRLEKGEATEHVAHLVKTEGLDKMETNELIDLLNRQKEASNSKE